MSLKYILNGSSNSFSKTDCISLGNRTILIDYSYVPFVSYSVNYLRTFKLKKYLHWNTSIGVGNSIEILNLSMGFYIPFTANLVLGTHKNYLETGLGIALRIDKFSLNPENNENFGFFSSIYPSVKIGYLFQPKSNGLSIRIDLTEYYSFRVTYNPILGRNTDKYIILPQLGIGYSW